MIPQNIPTINPKITSTKGEQEVDEGCLSFPNQYAKVIRPKEVTVEALDRSGKKIVIHAKDLLAQAICHELDHLEGKLYVDLVEGKLRDNEIDGYGEDEEE